LDCDPAKKDFHTTDATDASKCVADDPAPAAGCKDDTTCTTGKLTKCSVPTGTCYDPAAKANAECTKKTDGKSVTLAG